MGNMLAVPTKLGKKQLNLWISEDTNDALQDLARELHLRGRTQAAEVIIEEYLAGRQADVEFEAATPRRRTSGSKKVGKK